MGIVYLNGEFIEQSKAMISVMDRGFLFGDGIYEAIPAYNNHLFHLKDHLKRLNYSLNAINLAPPHTDEEYEKILLELLEKNRKKNHDDYYFYMQITRGCDDIRLHTFPEKSKPTLFITCKAFTFKTVEQLSQGFSAVTTEDTRRKRCDIKAISLLPNVLSCQIAKEKKADEAILIRDDFATEGAKSNLFIVKDGHIKTPPANESILHGITRKVVIECAKQLEIPLTEEKISLSELKDCDEIWLTSSSKEIMPVTKLDSKLINQGKAGPIWYKMIEQFQKNKTYQKVADTGSNIDFPCDFHIKVMGKANDSFKNTVFDLLKTEFPDIKNAPLDEKLSKNKNYLSLNITVHLNDKDQLNRVYQLLKDCPEVLMSL